MAPIRPRRHNTRVPLARISWLLIVGACAVAAVLLLVNGYSGYFGVLIAVGLAAASNLFSWPRTSAPPPERDVASRH
jgi:hypothetical protein